MALSPEQKNLKLRSQMTNKKLVRHQNELLMATTKSLSAGKSVSAQGCKNFADCQVHNNSPLNKLLLYIYLFSM